ncbi:hypothetical protein [Paenibacillus pabuli]|uniref:hypothetical protein n=1 Tax=Paenibacillus pabuli TaxID=1472 RepID=UPI000DB93170|nr:hypothetical protein [Paenibacillus pabuli]
MIMAVLGIYRGVTFHTLFPFLKRGIEETPKSKAEELKKRACWYQGTFNDLYELNVAFIPKRGRMDKRANLGDGCVPIAAVLSMPKRGCS